MGNFEIIMSIIFVIMTSYIIWDSYSRKHRNNHKH